MRYSAILTSLLILAGSASTAFAQGDQTGAADAFVSDTVLSAPPLSASVDDDDHAIIMIGQPSSRPIVTVQPSARVFQHLDGRSDLTRTDKAAIKAEIASRFGQPPRVATPQTGLEFAPDITMVLKPLNAAGQLRTSDRPYFE